MKNLNHFIYKVENYIKNNGLQDVIELTPLFEELELPDWKSLVDTKSGRPSTTTVFQSDYVRILIICWDAKQQSSIHGHKEGGGLIKVLQGNLHETRFDPIDKEMTGKFDYSEGDITYIHDMLAWHQVKNPGDHLAYSLHMYTRSLQAA